VILRPKTHLLYVSIFLTAVACAGTTPASPTFTKDVLPILQAKCQPCHRPGEIGPMPLITYEQTRPWGKAMVDEIKSGKMPPWFADKCCGEFSPGHTLKPEEIAAIEAWVTGGSLEGKKKDAPKPIAWANDWKIDGPSVVVSLPHAFEVPANAKVEDQYVILPIDLAEDKWASAVEIHPSDRSVVSHAVLYVRSKQSAWLRNVPRLTMYAPPPGSTNPDEATEILALYTPGSPAAIWPEGMGKKLPAGSDLVLQLHYSGKKIAATDRTSVGINFLKERPVHRVLTLEMQNRAIVVPPGATGYHAQASGVMPRDVLLLGMSPQMQSHATSCEYTIVQPGGSVETLLRVKPQDFFWQTSYPLKTPKVLPKGARVMFTGFFDNSANNPETEAMTGFFDVAVEANVDKVSFISSPAP
jgi:hypothetical protein